jgi:cytokinin riboside 5'-monophosphate phosphoribohydrolase
MRICVYCSSSERVGPAYVRAAQTMGEELAARGHELVYGGGCTGLMGIVARAVHSRGGRVTGIIPERMLPYEVAYLEADELITTESMAERKGLMIARSDGFIALPGGFGTLEEMTEVLTLKQLGYLDAALALLNVDGFYDPLTAFFERLIALEFVHPDHRTLYHLAETPADALDHAERYGSTDVPAKWF